MPSYSICRHSRLKATLGCLAATYYWPAMISRDLWEFIRHCSTCQHNKHLTQKQIGLLQPLSRPMKV
ncbi:hypothetical protein Fmac_009236 [Flemingia macrophylla]|uniref:Integrase zinc-binding domain-containing protein n=1 Tax=Flemingia macrophylla TaxID=520843 RepID=A0ABD1N086_9FABA